MLKLLAFFDFPVYNLPMRAIFICIFFSLAACATVTAEREQIIHVETQPAEAHCVLKNKAGQWELTSPDSVAVKRDFSPLAIQCESNERTGSRILQPHTRGRAYGNILLGGVPAIVDAETGAGYEYDADPVVLTLE